MKRIATAAFVLSLLLFISASADSGPIYYLWDLPLTSSAVTYADRLEKQKHITLNVEKEQKNDHYEYIGTSENSDITVYGYPATITLNQKTKTSGGLTPYSASVSVNFNKITERDYASLLEKGQSTVDTIYSGLTSKYGNPTSFRIKYNNFLYADSGNADYETETIDASSDFYTGDYIFLPVISESWKYPKEDRSVDLEVLFSNIKLAIKFWTYQQDQNAGLIECTVTFFSDVPEPIELNSKSIVVPTKAPEYQDSGL